MTTKQEIDMISESRAAEPNRRFLQAQGHFIFLELVFHHVCYFIFPDHMFRKLLQHLKLATGKI